MRASSPLLRPAIAFGLALQCGGMAHAQLPSGGVVSSGSASINQSGTNQVINQGTSRAVINWQDFSIGSGNSVRFNQPNSSSVILNRVVGNNPSSILGNLSANGQVFLVNPWGIYFGAGAVVDVGGLVASTMNIRNEDFMAGNYVFNRDYLSSTRREVINAGVLKAREGGHIVLAGDYAANSGIIQARLGTVALGSGSKMTLDIAGDSLINVAVNEKAVADLSGVQNSGQLLADGGRAIMTASVARELAGTAVNNSGLIRAQSTVERDGAIYLSADGGNTQVSGTLDASGTAPGRQGGTIDVLGNKVALTDNAVLDASGDTGGGTIRIGGAFQGQGPQTNASTAYVGKDVQIKADALGNGKGGNVVVWSNDKTRFYGSISAQGGAQGGDGGEVEVSGKAWLDFVGKVLTLAPKGKAGTLLLDPTDIEILNSIGATPDMTAASPFEDASNNGGTSQMTVAALETALAGGNVTVRTTSAGTAPKGGTITVDDGAGGGVQWGSGNSLRLQADNRILIKSPVEGNGMLWLDAGGGVIQSPGAHIAASSLLLTGSGFFDLIGFDGTFITQYNNVGTLAANLANGSTIRYSANQNLTIGTVNGVSGVNVGSSGSVQLYHDKGNSLTLAQGVTANNMFFRGSGAVTQTGGALQVSSVGITGNSSSVSLTGANNIGTIGVSANGPVNINNSGRLTVGAGTFGVNGITTNNNNVTITTGDAAGFDATKLPDGTNPASLTLNERINAGTGTVVLTAGTGGVYQRHDLNADNTPNPAGSITAGNLLLQGSSASKVTPFVLTNSNNLVGTLAGRANGSISYVGGPLTVGTVNGANGIVTTSNTIVTPSTTINGSTTPDIYNDNNISLSVGGDLNINQNINAATTTGSGSVTIGVGGDYTAKTAPGVRIDANTLGVFGDDNLGTFKLVTKTSNLAAAGGKQMVIDNTAQTGDLTGIGIGAPATNASGTNNGSTVTVTSSSKPVGDFYLTTGGALNIIKLVSQGNNLMLRASTLNILLDATTADGARIMLQPLNPASRIGVNNSNDSDFTADTNYSASLLLKFTNPTATFYFGTPQDVIMKDANVPDAAKNIQTGDIHIGSDGAFNLGYRSISAQTSGNLVAHNAGPLYNLRLAAPNLTVNGFNTFGDQIHLFSNNLQLPGAASDYVNPNKPTITLRPLNDETVWVGLAPASKSRPNETQILSQYIVKLPDGSTVVISGSTDYPFPSGGAGYGDIHIPWNDALGASLGNRKLVLSTGNKLYTYAATPNYTQKKDGGTSGGLWQGCQNLTTCMGTNPNPNPTPTPDGGNSGGGGSPGGDTTPTNPGGGSGCDGCPPTPPNTNPYPPDTNPTDGGNTGGDGGNGSGSGSGGNGDGGNGGGDGGGGSGGGGAGDGSGGAGDGGNGSGSGSGGNGDGGNGGGDGGGGSGGGGTGDGNGGNSGNGDGNGDGQGGDTGGGSGTGNGDGGDGNGGGDGGAGNGNGGTGDGNGSGADGGNGDGSGNGSGGSGGDGNGGGDGGAGNGSGGTGDGGNGAGDGSGAGGISGDGAGNGSGSGGDGDGSGGGDGGAGNGSGGTGDGNDGGNGNAASGRQGNDISCESVSRPKEEEEQNKDNSGKQDLVQVKRDGVKMRDPCEEQRAEEQDRKK